MNATADDNGGASHSWRSKSSSCAATQIMMHAWCTICGASAIGSCMGAQEAAAQGPPPAARRAPHQTRGQAPLGGRRARHGLRAHAAMPQPLRAQPGSARVDPAEHSGELKALARQQSFVCSCATLCLQTEGAGSCRTHRAARNREGGADSGSIFDQPHTPCTTC